MDIKKKRKRKPETFLDFLSECVESLCFVENMGRAGALPCTGCNGELFSVEDLAERVSVTKQQ